eukprot:4426365-Amphidinium_carterae.2
MTLPESVPSLDLKFSHLGRTSGPPPIQGDRKGPSPRRLAQTLSRQLCWPWKPLTCAPSSGLPGAPAAQSRSEDTLLTTKARHAARPPAQIWQYAGGRLQCAAEAPSAALPCRL